MASLNILCSNPLKLKNEITKVEHKKIICGPSKNFEKCFMAHQYMQYFLTSTKTLQPRSYIRNVPSLIKTVRQGGQFHFVFLHVWIIYLAWIRPKIIIKTLESLQNRLLIIKTLIMTWAVKEHCLEINVMLAKAR